LNAGSMKNTVSILGYKNFWVSWHVVGGPVAALYMPLRGSQSHVWPTNVLAWLLTRLTRQITFLGIEKFQNRKTPCVESNQWNPLQGIEPVTFYLKVISF
jgi:hypothetical protein